MDSAKLRPLLRLLCSAVLVAATVPAYSQQPESTNEATSQVLRQLADQIATLQATIRELREETRQYHVETEQLRAELKSALASGQAAASTGTRAAADQGASPPAGRTDEARIARLQEEYNLLNAKVEDQYQTKVESASKYRLRLSGIALFNLFENRGAVDNQDIPTIALSTAGRAGGSFGGTLRQSQIGLDVFGPTWHGARIKGNLQMDFAGGFAETENGVTLGLMRLRTGVVRLDWPNTSVVVGQDAPFFSPLSPTSLASLAQPALSYAGNLWTWTPQLRVEHHFSTPGQSSITVQAGMLDPLTGGVPPDQFYRVPQAGEASRQPAYASRVAWNSSNEDRAVSFGVGGYFSRQDWGAGRTVNGWAVTTDASIPISRLFTVSGEFYRGRAIGGLGGALGTSVVYYGPAAASTTHVEGLDAIGGWAQLKLQATPKLEFNVAAGQDNPFASQFRDAAAAGAAYYGVARNRSILTNFLYRPRSDLLMSMEYRRIQSYQLVAPARDADQINLTMGVLF
jgi:hypothetical protein